jgi:chaperonin GroEL
LTGGRPFVKVAGDTFNRVKVEDFGRARRIWADTRNFGIIGGKGNPRTLRQHIATLRTSFEQTDEIVPRDKLRTRIGKLLGGSATLWVGGATELEIDERQELAKRTAAAMRGAMMEGVLPGGGVSLLACRPALQEKLDQSTEPDERAAYHILLKAMAEPIRTIIANAGHDASDVMAEIRLTGPGYGFDAISEQVVDVAQAGIWDGATVLKSAVYTAIASAAQALTVDILIHRTEQPDRATVSGPGKRKRL